MTNPRTPATHKVSIDTAILDEWAARAIYVAEMATIVGEAVKSIRIGLSITQKAVSDDTGLTPARLSSIENNKAVPDLAELNILILWMKAIAEGSGIPGQLALGGTPATEVDPEPVAEAPVEATTAGTLPPEADF